MLIEFKFMPWIYHHLSLCQKEKERHFPRKEACKYTLLVHVMSLEVGFAMHLKESVDSASDGGYSFIPPGTRPSNSADWNGIPYYLVDGLLKINSYSKGIIIHVIQHYGRTCYSSIQCYDRRGADCPIKDEFDLWYLHSLLQMHLINQGNHGNPYLPNRLRLCL